MDKSQVRRLRKAMENSASRMESYRDNRKEVINQYVGAHYSESGADDKTPLGYMELAITTYMYLLTAGDIRAEVGTEYRKLSPQAKDLELALNHLVQNEIPLDDTMEEFVMDAFFGLGIVKVGLHTDFQTEAHGFTHDVAQPFCDNVSIEDFILDMDVKRWDQIAFCGDRYRVPLEEARANPLYDKEARRKLTSTDMSDTGQGRSGEELEGPSIVEKLSRPDGEHHAEEYKKQVELWDVWLPDEGQIVTISAKKQPAEPLRAVDWNGPEAGPYRFLKFNQVPEQILPLPPTALWRDLHDIANRLFNKIARQGERQKTVLGVRSGSDEDGQRITNASDGEAISLDDPQAAQEYNFGGPNQNNFGLMVHLRQVFSYMAGNLDSLGGLRSNASTLGQQEIISENATARLKRMREKVSKAYGTVLEDLGFYLHTDPLIEIHTTKRIPGTKMTIPVTYSAEEREGDFWQYNFDVDARALRSSSPSDKLQGIQFALQNLIGPFAGPMMEQGFEIDFGELTMVLSDLLNLPELRRIVKRAAGGDLGYQAGPYTPPGSSEGESGGSYRPPGTGQYERVSRSVPSEQGTESNLLQQLMGGGGGEGQGQGSPMGGMGQQGPQQ